MKLERTKQVKDFKIGDTVEVIFPESGDQNGFSITGEIVKHGVGDAGVESKGGLTVLKTGETETRGIPLIQPVHGTASAKLVK